MILAARQPVVLSLSLSCSRALDSLPGCCNSVRSLILSSLRLLSQSLSRFCPPYLPFSLDSFHASPLLPPSAAAPVKESLLLTVLRKAGHIEMKFRKITRSHTRRQERRQRGREAGGISLVMLASCKHESRIMKEDFSCGCCITGCCSSSRSTRRNQAKYTDTRLWCQHTHDERSKKAESTLIFIDVCVTLLLSRKKERRGGERKRSRKVNESPARAFLSFLDRRVPHRLCLPLRTLFTSCSRLAEDRREAAAPSRLYPGSTPTDSTAGRVQEQWRERPSDGDRKERKRR